MDAFKTLLGANRPVLIDGGLATQCEAMGHDIGTDLWSAELLISQPDAIVEAHRAYLEAGAQVIISASYQASRPGFAALGLSQEESDQLIRRSVRLALRAREDFLDAHPGTHPVPLVAASVGPYGATLHDGSEYTGEYGIGSAALATFHHERLQVLDRSGADVLACETIPSARESAVLDELLRQCQTPAWLSFSCKDEARLSDGTPIMEVIRPLADHPNILALGVNCTAPQFIPALVRAIRQAAPGKAVVVYPNSGEKYDARDNSWHGLAEPLELADAMGGWLDAGATLVGGCCRMGPDHIQAMNKELDRKTKTT